MGGSGVQKSLKFVKYLSNYNYLPIVLTVNPRFTRWTKDQSLVKDIPPSTIVYKAPTIDMNWFFKLLSGEGFDKVATAHHKDDQIETFFRIGLLCVNIPWQ